MFADYFKLLSVCRKTHGLVKILVSEAFVISILEPTF